MNSELSKFIEEGLKNGQVHQPKQTNRLLLSSSNSSSSNSHNSSQHNKEQQLQKQQDQQVPEISAGTVWKGLFAFLIALIILLYMFTSSSVQKQDQIDLEFRLGNAKSENARNNNYSSSNSSNSFRNSSQILVVNQTKDAEIQIGYNDSKIDTNASEIIIGSLQDVGNDQYVFLQQNVTEEGNQKVYKKDGLLCIEGLGQQKYKFCHPVN
eukprot:TRINITY_DN3403_c0_g1_i4.p2 TRINITY_DN3403_c0_g1~~TRINITY_DN3403_c0_g1_i4.p2  ORF type:complete len:210 (+),score=26.81 TRINITY_DN3403_c0_g1_i4:44-673(+)